MSEAMKYKLPPLSDDIENHLSWYSDHKADRIRSLIQSYAIAALEQQRQIEAQGVPDGLLNVLDNFEKKERSPFQAYLAAGLVNELRTAMLASAPPAPQVKQCEWTNCPTRVGEKCCNEQASGVQQEPEPVAWLHPYGGVLQFRATGYEKENYTIPLYTHPAPQAKPLPLSADRDARIAELERELEKEKQYVKEMTKDHHHWMTVAAERALLLDKNRKVNKPLSDYEFDEIG